MHEILWKFAPYITIFQKKKKGKNRAFTSANTFSMHIREKKIKINLNLNIQDCDIQMEVIINPFFLYLLTKNKWLLYQYFNPTKNTKLIIYFRKPLSERAVKQLVLKFS